MEHDRADEIARKFPKLVRGRDEIFKQITNALTFEIFNVLWETGIDGWIPMNNSDTLFPRSSGTYNYVVWMLLEYY